MKSTPTRTPTPTLGMLIVYSTRVHARIPNGHPREENRAACTRVLYTISIPNVGVGVRVGVDFMEFQLYGTVWTSARHQLMP